MIWNFISYYFIIFTYNVFLCFGTILIWSKYVTYFILLFSVYLIIWKNIYYHIYLHLLFNILSRYLLFISYFIIINIKFFINLWYVFLATLLMFVGWNNSISFVKSWLLFIYIYFYINDMNISCFVCNIYIWYQQTI